MKDLANAIENSLAENLSLQEMENLEGGAEELQAADKVANALADCKNVTNNCKGGNCASGCGN